VLWGPNRKSLVCQVEVVILPRIDDSYCIIDERILKHGDMLGVEGLSILVFYQENRSQATLHMLYSGEQRKNFWSSTMPPFSTCCKWHIINRGLG